MVKIIITPRKQDLVRISDPSILHHPLKPIDSTDAWVEEIKARVTELKEQKCKAMDKPEYQALLLMNSLPKTALWRRFKAKYPVQNKWGAWNPGYYKDGKWVLTLDFLQGLLHIYLSHLVSDYIYGRTPAKRPAPVETELVEWVESSQADDITPHPASLSLARSCESSSSSMRSTLTSKKRC